MKKAYLVKNSDGLIIKACSTLKKARQFGKDCQYRHEGRYLTNIIEIEIDGEEWGTMFDFEDEDE